MIENFGLDVVQAYMRHVQDNAEEAVRRVIDALEDGEFAYETDSGAVIRVRVSVDRENRSATVDFTGTSPQLSTNFNAPFAVVNAAVLLCVFRTLVADDIPLNDGCLRPLDIVVPRGSMLAPEAPPRWSRAMWRPLRRSPARCTEPCACRPRVRNDEQRHLRQRALPVYETVASGSGAGDGFPGASSYRPT